MIRGAPVVICSKNPEADFALTSRFGSWAPEEGMATLPISISLDVPIDRQATWESHNSAPKPWTFFVRVGLGLGLLNSAVSFMRFKSSLTLPTLLEIAIVRQQFTVPLCEELNGAGFEVIHRTCNLDAAFGFKLPKHATLFPNVGNSQ